MSAVSTLKGSLQRQPDSSRLNKTPRTIFGAHTHSRKSQSALALIEPHSAMSLITAPATQQRIAVAIFVSLCCIVPALTPQGKKYQQKLMMSRSGLAELTKRNYALLTVLTCSCLPFFFGVAIGFTSPCLGPMCTDLSLSTVQASSFASVLSIGAVAAAFLGMRQVNLQGRKPVLVMCGAFYAVGYLLITMGSYVGYGGLLLGRFFTGMGAGLANVVCPMYIAEMSPPALRGLFGTFYQMAICAGILGIYVIGAWADWKVAATIAGVLATATTIACKLYMPETPAYLVQRGKDQEAGGVLRRLVMNRTQQQAEDIVAEIRKAGEDVPAKPTQGLNQADAADERKEIAKAAEAKAKGGISAILSSRKMRRSLAIVSLLMFFQQFTGINCVMYFSTQILDAAGYGVSASKAAIVLALAQLVGTSLSASQADALSRRSVLLFSGLGMALGMALISAFFAFQAGLLSGLPLMLQALLEPLTAVLGLFVYILLFSVGWGPVPWLLVSELFPPQKRPLATGVCTLLAWVGTFTVTQSSTIVLATAGPVYIFSAFLLVTLMSIAWVASPFFVETSGKSMTQVQQELSGPKPKLTGT